MIAGAHGSVPPLRDGLRAHQTQHAIQVIVLKEIQFARPAEKMVPIKQNSGLHWTTDHTSHCRCSTLKYHCCHCITSDLECALSPSGLMAKP